MQVDERIFPLAFFSVKVHRCASYYVWNILVPATCFVVLGMLQFSLPPDDSTRLEISLGLVLVTVLFKFAVVSPSNFPTVAYLTLLDQHLLWCNFAIFVMALENGLVRLVARNKHVNVD